MGSSGVHGRDVSDQDPLNFAVAALHLGVGILGGFLPFAVMAMTIYYGNIIAGLWYPVIIAAVTALIGVFIVPGTKDGNID
jgi:hypothetical protein